MERNHFIALANQAQAKIQEGSFLPDTNSEKHIGFGQRLSGRFPGLRSDPRFRDGFWFPDFVLRSFFVPAAVAVEGSGHPELVGVVEGGGDLGRCVTGQSS